MSRVFSACLCAIVVFVSVAGAAVYTVAPALAASGVLTIDTPLHDSPNPGAPMLALLQPGTVVTVDGPPVEGFYPVSVNGVTGWMRGETMQLTKDAPAGEADATPETTEDLANGEVPIAQDASETPLTDAELAPPGEDVAPVDQAAPAPDAPVDNGLVAEPPVVADDASGENGVTQAPPPAAEPDPNAAQTDPDEAIAPVDANASNDPNAPVSPDTDPVVEQIDAPADGQPAVDTAAPVDAAVATDPAAPVDHNEPELIDPATGNTMPGPVSTPATTDGQEQILSPDPQVISATVTQPPVQTGETTADPAADPAAAPAPAPVEASTPPPADVTTQTLAAPATETPAAEPAPAPEATPAPTPTPEPPLALNGPAYVLVDMPVRDGPGSQYGLVFTVPAGSSLNRTGEYKDGWISVNYKEVWGWAQADQMSEPIPVEDEKPLSDQVNTKEPKPGSGVAFVNADLSLRAGPSANEEPIVVVPAGSRVILTGVMEGDFQRVTYGDYVGWISNSFLENPDNPAPNGQGTGKQENYSRKQIVKYINAAADKYGQDRGAMLRVATCESNLDPYAVNPSGSYGLFQFIRSTWKSTPYGDQDIFDPQANANAAAWMWKQGRKSEWVCQ
ncbi:MAG: SH3 domain-containing protein [Thermomicrobiales bacterium]